MRPLARARADRKLRGGSPDRHADQVAARKKPQAMVTTAARVTAPPRKPNASIRIDVESIAAAAAALRTAAADRERYKTLADKAKATIDGYNRLWDEKAEHYRQLCEAKAKEAIVLKGPRDAAVVPWKVLPPIAELLRLFSDLFAAIGAGTRDDRWTEAARAATQAEAWMRPAGSAYNDISRAHAPSRDLPPRDRRRPKMRAPVGRRGRRRQAGMDPRHHVHRRGDDEPE